LKWGRACANEGLSILLVGGCPVSQIVIDLPDELKYFGAALLAMVDLVRRGAVPEVKSGRAVDYACVEREVEGAPHMAFFVDGAHRYLRGLSDSVPDQSASCRSSADLGRR